MKPRPSSSSFSSIRWIWFALILLLVYTTWTADKTSLQVYSSSYASVLPLPAQILTTATTTIGYNDNNNNNNWNDLSFLMKTSSLSLHQECPPGTHLYVPPLYTDKNNTPTSNELKIPRIIHMRVPSRCLQDNTDDSFLTSSSSSLFIVVLWDDSAVQTLLFERYWKQFPHLQQLIRPCLSKDKTHALWKALVLYQYGGVIVDSFDHRFTTIAPAAAAAADSITTPTHQTRLETFLVNASSQQQHASISRIAITFLDDIRDSSNENDKNYHQTARLAPILQESLVAATPRHGLNYLWVHVILLDALSLRSVDSQWEGLQAQPDVNSLTIAWRHWKKQVEQSNNKRKKATPLQVGWQQDEQSNDLLHVLPQNEINSIVPLPLRWRPTESSISPMPQNRPWGNTDTCLVRTFRVHETKQSQPQPPKNHNATWDNQKDMQIEKDGVVGIEGGNAEMQNLPNEALGEDDDDDNAGSDGQE